MTRKDIETDFGENPIGITIVSGCVYPDIREKIGNTTIIIKREFATRFYEEDGIWSNIFDDFDRFIINVSPAQRWFIRKLTNEV